MEESIHWNTYHRSRFKRLVGEKVTAAFFTTSPGTKPDKTGAYYNPFHFKAYQKAVIIKKAGLPEEYDLDTYDDLLCYQHGIASYITNKLNALNLKLAVNCDNQYPCVLINFPKPAVAKEKDWVNFVILYFTALSVKLAEERGLNCELVRRSGFGHMRPSVAETAPSMRINVGIIPLAYADVLVDAAELTYSLLCKNPSTVFSQAVDLPEVDKLLASYNKKKIADKSKAIKLSDTVWDNLWSRMDKRGYSLVSQLLRREINAEAFINTLLDEMRASGLSLDDLLESPNLRQKAFVTPWLAVLQSLKLNATNQLGIEPAQTTLPTYKWAKKAVAVDDEPFVDCVNQLLKSFDQPADLENGEQTLQGLHSKLETASRSLFFNPSRKPHDDGCGSDSETEADVVIDKKKMTIYAKKFITATGMRSIQLAFAAIKGHLGQEAKLNFRNLGFDAQYMYYESPIALRKHAIRLELDSVNNLAKAPNLVLYDLNHCNVEHVKTPAVVDLVKKCGPVCILDTTSATMSYTALNIKALFKANKELKAIILVSSGLKNEQGGADLNPYGTLRIFAREKAIRESLYAELVKIEEEVGYKHPKYSHLIRKTAKEHGMTPTNHGILAKM